jgi:hypothetical protein
MSKTHQQSKMFPLSNKLLLMSLIAIFGLKGRNPAAASTIESLTFFAPGLVL